VSSTLPFSQSFIFSQHIIALDLIRAAGFKAPKLQAVSATMSGKGVFCMMWITQADNSGGSSVVVVDGEAFGLTVKMHTANQDHWLRI
jgi:hypothetical protein